MKILLKQVLSHTLSYNPLSQPSDKSQKPNRNEAHVQAYIFSHNVSLALLCICDEQSFDMSSSGSPFPHKLIVWQILNFKRIDGKVVHNSWIDKLFQLDVSIHKES